MSDHYSQREYRRLNYTSQLTTDIRHIKGESNYTALSCIQVDADTLTVLDLPATAADQASHSSCTQAQHSITIQCPEVP